jgi:choline kinase
MEEYKVLITTSGTGSRLGDLTKYTNKSLVRVGDKPTLSYIIELYPKSTNFVVTLGHFGDHVRQFLELAYPDINFTFVIIDNYEGYGSSLGYSILQTKKYLQCSFIYHASDTIIKNPSTIPPLEYNWVSYSKKEDFSPYATLRISGDYLEEILDKGDLNSNLCYIGHSGIKDYKLFWEKLEGLYDPTRKDLSDTHVINEMLKTTAFETNEVVDWLDTGNVSGLQKTRGELVSSISVLDKKDESIYFFDDFVIKFFSDAVVAKNRVHRAHNLKGRVPSIIDSCDNFYKYKKAEGSLLANVITASKFSNLLSWSKKELWKKREVKNFSITCRDFYIEKTIKRINEYLKEKEDLEENINGEQIPPVFDIFNKIDFQWLCNGEPCEFHGDFILDNIIETRDSFKLIDWRQDFGGGLEVGDLYYDLAKLNHNLTVNHDIVSKGLYQYTNGDCYILINSKLNECRNILHKFIVDNGYDLFKVEVLTSLIWLNMSPLHEYPFSDFLFTFGKYYLYKNIVEINRD